MIFLIKPLHLRAACSWVRTFSRLFLCSCSRLSLICLEILEPCHVCTCICSKILYPVQRVCKYKCTAILHNMRIILQHTILTRTAVLLLRYRNANNEVVNQMYQLLYAVSYASDMPVTNIVLVKR